MTFSWHSTLCREEAALTLSPDTEQITAEAAISKKWAP